MGYYISQENCSFHIPKKNIGKMLAAIQKEMTEGTTAGLNAGAILAAIARKDVKAVFDEVPFDITVEDGAIVSVWYQGDKAWEGMEHFLSVIAPFVDEGSFIEFSGEGGDLYRYVFKGGKCGEQWPTVTWD